MFKDSRTRAAMSRVGGVLFLTLPMPSTSCKLQTDAINYVMLALKEIVKYLYRVAAGLVLSNIPSIFLQNNLLLGAERDI